MSGVPHTDQVLDDYNRPVPGAQIYVTDTLTLGNAQLTIDGTTALTQPVIADEFGFYTYYANDGIYREDIYYGGKLRYKGLAYLGTPPQLKGDPGGNVLAIGFFSAANTFTIPAGTDVVRTSGFNTLGQGAAYYIYDATINAAYVTANPRTSFLSYNGLGFKLAPQELQPEMFGAVGNGTVTGGVISGTDDTPAFQAMRSYASSIAVDAGSGLSAGPPFRLQGKAYYLASSFSWKGCSNIWYGTDSGLPQFAEGAGSTILMAPGCTFTVDRADTENGGTGTAISPYSGESTTFRHIRWAGAAQGSGSAPLVKWRGRASAYNCRFMQGGSHGLAIDATAGSGGATEGNANCWRLFDCAFIANGGSGLAVGTAAGGDVNGGVAVGCTFEGNNRYGIEHAGFLGDQFLGNHFAANTLGHVNQSNANAVCHFNGYYESGVPASSLAGRSYASGPGSGTNFPNLQTINANNGLMEFGTGIQADGDVYSSGSLRITDNGAVFINGNQVLAGRVTGTPPVATDLTSALNLVNFIRSALLTSHGAIG